LQPCRDGRFQTTVNQPPQAVDDYAMTGRGRPVEIDVLANDSDPNDDPLSIVAVTPPMQGTTTHDGERVVYRPQVEFVGTDMFTYTISDGIATSTATVTVEVTDHVVFMPLVAR
jgi:hypothetical protein